MIVQIVSFFLGWCLILGSMSAIAAYLFCVCVTGKPESDLMLSGWELLKSRFVVHAILIAIGITCMLYVIF